MVNNTQKKKVFEFNKKTITACIAVLLFIIILVLSLITLFSSVKASNLAFLDYRYYIMDATSKENIAKKGDLVIAKKAKYGQTSIGDSIVYGDGKVYYCDSVVDVKKNNTVTKMIIAENAGIKYQFSEDEISGKVVKVIPGLGSFISFLRTPLGIVFFIGIVICIALLLKFAFIRA